MSLNHSYFCASWETGEITITALPAAERYGGARDPHIERAMRTSSSLRNVATREPSDWRLDPFLQHSASAASAQVMNFVIHCREKSQKRIAALKNNPLNYQLHYLLTISVEWKFSW